MFGSVILKALGPLVFDVLLDLLFGHADVFELDFFVGLCDFIEVPDSASVAHVVGAQRFMLVRVELVVVSAGAFHLVDSSFGAEDLAVVFLECFGGGAREHLDLTLAGKRFHREFLLEFLELRNLLGGRRPACGPIVASRFERCFDARLHRRHEEFL